MTLYDPIAQHQEKSVKDHTKLIHDIAENETDP